MPLYLSSNATRALNNVYLFKYLTTTHALCSHTRYAYRDKWVVSVLCHLYKFIRVVHIKRFPQIGNSHLDPPRESLCEYKRCGKMRNALTIKIDKLNVE